MSVMIIIIPSNKPILNNHTCSWLRRKYDLQRWSLKIKFIWLYY